jgi:hypothetical protein
MPLTEQGGSVNHPDRQAGAEEKANAIAALARRLYVHMEVEDPYWDKPWEALPESEREFYLSAIYHVLSWKDTVLTALGFPQPSDNNPVNRSIDDRK